MILKEYNLSVRLPQEKAIDTGITFVQNDKDVYKLNIRVFDGVNEIHYSEVESATITFAKSDGKVVQGDMQVEVDKLTYVLGTNEIAAPGKLLASIQLLGANERLTTARFLFRVEKDLITEDAVKSTSEFAILQRLKEELEAIDVVDLTNQFNAHLADYATYTTKTSIGFPFAEGFKNAAVPAKIEKNNNMVTLYISFQKIDGTAFDSGAVINLGVIPVGYRPAMAMITPIGFSNGPWAITNIGYMYIDMSGTIQVMVNGSNLKYGYGVITYHI